MKAFSILLAAGLIAGCNPVANMNAGEDRIEKFQAAYSRGDDDTMWEMAGKEWREVSTREDFDRLVTTLESRLGPIKGTERGGFNVNSTPMGTTTVVQMTTEFAQGRGTETYTFLGNGDDMRLVGWNVNSDRLLVTPEEIDQLENNAPDEDRPESEADMDMPAE